MPSGGAVIGMWGEARRQEKMIRGAMVDLRKRAERRSQYYERIKLDPAQFLRVHGRKVTDKKLLNWTDLIRTLFIYS